MYAVIYRREGGHTPKLLGYATRPAAVAFAERLIADTPKKGYKQLVHLQVGRVVLDDIESFVEPERPPRPTWFCTQWGALPDEMSRSDVVQILARAAGVDESVADEWCDDCEAEG